MESKILIIGGGLAGCEAAWQAARRGCPVLLHEMKPGCFSPAHTSPHLAELVCSNSLRSNALDSAVGLLKEEMRRLGSLIMETADRSRVPAGKALAVDREEFSARITRRIENHPLISVVRQEMRAIPDPGTQWPAIIIATGPLTSDALTESLIRYTGREHLAFYDAIAPIVEADSLDYGIVYQASRYEAGPGDYLNCPMDEGEYRAFIAAVRAAEKVALKSFETPRYFEGCLPIEVTVERGEDTPRYGPMKPVGLPDPRTGHEPYAVVQLRKENRAGSLYNMVGFQTKLTYPEQKRVFRMIPGMAGAEFTRLGSIHRNTFICAPELMLPSLQLRSRPDLLLAGQLSGVEGYVESTAMGLLAGINAASIYRAEALPMPPPAATAMGSLITHLTETEPRHFQPSNVNFGLLPALTGKVPRKSRGKYYSERALKALDEWLKAEV